MAAGLRAGSGIAARLIGGDASPVGILGAVPGCCRVGDGDGTVGDGAEGFFGRVVAAFAGVVLDRAAHLSGEGVDLLTSAAVGTVKVQEDRRPVGGDRDARLAGEVVGEGAQAVDEGLARVGVGAEHVMFLSQWL